MNARELTREIKRRARAEGFEAVGIAAAERIDRDALALAAWLREGHHASMAWMARDPERRSDPRRLLPGCRSVIALTSNYWPGAMEQPHGTGKVARYAQGRDYHRVLGKKLRSLASWLEDLSGEPARAFLDTAPLLERAWAERAGLGWVGKNANLIARDRGSWLLLGEILSAARLEPAPGPHEEFCGTCRACIEACPTQAIISDGVVDARLCISYWTIEHRGSIPVERRSGMADWIFGCDVCQEVCPWNERFARVAPEARFARRTDLARLDAAEILRMDESTFRQRFSGTALMRAKWEGMRRNACLVLGNLGDHSAVSVLAEALQDDDVVVRAHAAWALGRIGGPRPSRLLFAALGRERSSPVVEELESALRDSESRSADE
jgi:epoxyqueuosine reductase